MLRNPIVSPSYSRECQYKTDSESDGLFPLKCTGCGGKFQINLNLFIPGSGQAVEAHLITEAKVLFDIPVVGKSHDGGWPEFRVVNCANCSKSFLGYAGAKEVSNSIWHITLQGIAEVDS